MGQNVVMVLLNGNDPSSSSRRWMSLRRDVVQDRVARYVAAASRDRTRRTAADDDGQLQLVVQFAGQVEGT